MSERSDGPRWWPDIKTVIVAGLFGLTGYILWVTKPAPGAEPSEFFKAIAQAVVLTGFLAAVGSFFQASAAAEKATAATTAQSGKLVDALTTAAAAQTPLVVSAPATVDVVPGPAATNESDRPDQPSG